jgi:superfamily II DNA/RNA helicase
LTPTRELAIQLNETATAVCRYAPYVKSALAYGGVPKSSQAIPLRRGVDIVIATPGIFSFYFYIFFSKLYDGIPIIA